MTSWASWYKRSWFKYRRALRNSTPGPMQDFYQATLPAPATRLHDVEFVALDFETTGLNPEADQYQLRSCPCSPACDRTG